MFTRIPGWLMAAFVLASLTGCGGSKTEEPLKVDNLKSRFNRDGKATPDPKSAPKN